LAKSLINKSLTKKHMPDSLEEMLAKAQAAETTTGQKKQVEQQQTKAPAEAQLRDKLKQREGALGEAAQAEGGAQKSGRLKIKGRTTYTGQGKYYPRNANFFGRGQRR
jgi:hypothetical protein